MLARYHNGHTLRGRNLQFHLCQTHCGFGMSADTRVNTRSAIYGLMNDASHVGTAQEAWGVICATSP